MKSQEIGRFAFGIRLSLSRDGKLHWQTQSVNQDVPDEIIIMQMKAFLQQMEKGFFGRFEANLKK